jgi:hypothetical protein
MLSLSQPVCAQEATEPAQGTAAAAPSPAPAVAPTRPESAQDIVRLKNGGIVRGSISELDPKGSVIIVTLTGAVREYPMSDVTYAGPATKDPKATSPSTARASSELASSREGSTKPYVTVHAKEARLHLVSNPGGLTFHRQSSSAVAEGMGRRAVAHGYDRLCTAPCDITIPSGTETLALSEDDSDVPIAAEPIYFSSGDSVITGKLDSNATVRAAGWITMIGGGIAGLALILTSMKEEETCDSLGCRETPKLDTTQMLVGASLAAIGPGVGFFLIRVRDSATIETGSGVEDAALRRLPRANGVALRGSF